MIPARTSLSAACLATQSSRQRISSKCLISSTEKIEPETEKRWVWNRQPDPFNGHRFAGSYHSHGAESLGDERPISRRS